MPIQGKYAGKEIVVKGFVTFIQYPKIQCMCLEHELEPVTNGLVP